MHRFIWLRLLVVACALVVGGVSSGAEQASGEFLSRIFTDEQGTQHPFFVFVPARLDPAARPPVMLFLHGSGERGNNNLDQMMVGLAPAIWKRKTKFPFVVVLPQCRKESGWLVTSPDAQRAVAMLRQVQTEFRTDPDRVILTGLSMGGAGTWSIAGADPTAWSAIVPMCARPDAADAKKFAA